MESPTTPVRIEHLLAHREWVRRLARSLVIDESRAADLEQEVWLSALERPPRDLRSPRGWLATALRHAALNLRRSEGRRARREEECSRPETVSSAADLVAEAETERRVVGAVLKLEEPYRSTVLLRWFDDLPPEEIARHQHAPVETVRTRLRRAMEQLRDRLDRENNGDRRAWILALLPLARRTEVPGLTTSAAIGGLLMTMKAKAAVAAGAVAILALLGWFTLGGDGAKPVAPAVGGSAVKTPVPTVVKPPPQAAAIAPEPKPAVVPPVPAPAAVEHLVRGRVTDDQGHAVPGAMVLVASTEDPFEGMAGRPVISSGAKDGEKFFPIKGPAIPVDAEGRFEARFAGPKRVYLAVAPGVPGIRPAGEGRWVDTPSEGIELRAALRPTGTLVVRLLDQGTGKPIAGFGVSFQGKGCGFLQRGVEGDVLEQVVELSPGAAEETVQVNVIRPVELSRDAVLPAGGRVEVAFTWTPSAEVRGSVLSMEGTPVEGALVFLGEQVLARGDEPFKPFDEKRVPQAVRTGATGEFAIRGDGSVVTVWHPNHSPVTVPLNACTEIRLPARGAIHGRLVDAAGTPVAGVELALDRTRRATTDAEGRFAFDGVEAGVRGLLLPGKRYVAVRVAPGVKEELEISPGIPEVRVEVLDAGKPITEPLRGILIGLDRLGSQHELKIADGSCAVSGVLPGRFLFLTTTGLFSRAEVQGPAATVELGKATLTVRAPPGTSVCLAPGEPDPLVDLFAMRVGHRAVPASGALSFPGLADGAYRILTEVPPGSGRKATETPVSIRDGREAVVDLPPGK